MAGAQQQQQQLEMVERETQKSIMTTTTKQQQQQQQNSDNHYQWKVHFARCFTYPSSYLSQTTITTSSSSSSSSLKPLKRSLFKPTWISSSEFSTVSLHPSADRNSSSDSILTVSLQGTTIEEHFISTLQFAWPQVSCLSGFPTRGSLVVLASYVDHSNEKQKFALQFSRMSDVEDFVTSLEDILSNKVPNERPAVDVISAISSQSEIIPAYRPDTSSMRSPINNSTKQNDLHDEDQHNTMTQDTVPDSQSNAESFPPRFTSLVSSCSTEPERGKLALAVAGGPQDLDLRAQISKYMQDASFLDIVTKVNEVITELGGDFVIEKS